MLYYLVTKVEYRGAALAACEISWLMKLLVDLDIEVCRPLRLFCDNMSNVHLAHNHVYHAHTKHIEVHYHFIREMVLKTWIELKHVKTEDQIADIFTKSLGREKFTSFRELLGVMLPT